LFDCPIKVASRDAVKPVHANLATEARHAQILFIWTDCDREGEYIGWEVLTAAKKGNANIDVKRARFNNLERAYVKQNRGCTLTAGILFKQHSTRLCLTCTRLMLSLSAWS
jgi:DNA topoisomerase IA